MILVAVAMLAAASGPAWAAGLSQGKWYKACDKGECLIVTKASNAIRFVIRISKNGQLMAVASAALPLDPPYGMSWQIGDGKSIRVPYIQCQPKYCAAQVIINKEYIDALRNGGVLKLGTTLNAKQSFTRVSLTGLSARLDGKPTHSFADLTALMRF